MGWQIFGVFIVFVTSVYGGVSVLIARCAGAGDDRRVERCFAQALSITAFLSFGIFAPLGWLLAPWLLTLVHATPEVQAEALAYLRTLFLYNGGLVSFFLLGSALRSIGDAVTPMRLSLLMTSCNVAVTIVLVRGLGPLPPLGSRGAAISTVLSGTLAAAVAFYLLFKGRLAALRVPPARDFLPDFRILSEIFRFGLPMGLQSIALHAGHLILVRYVGALESSAEAQAVFSVAYGQIFLVVNLISISLTLAVATIVGQSLGAGRPLRAARTPRTALLLGLALNLPLAAAFAAVPEWWLGLFALTEGEVVVLGSQLLLYLSASVPFLTAAYVYTGALQGGGDTRGPLVITLVSQVALPVGMCAVLTATGALDAGGIWLAIALGYVLRALMSLLRFRTGRWREVRVDVAE